MRPESIGKQFLSSFHILIQSFGLLLIISFVAHYNAFAQPAPPTEEIHQDTCVLLQDAQTPIWVKDATPNGKVAVLTGFIKGLDTLKDGNCAGTEIGLNPHRKIITLIMNEEGEKKGDIFIPPTTAYSGFMQMVDLATCQAGDIKEIRYTDVKPDDSCFYSFPEDVAPMIFSGRISASGSVFQSEPFCASTLNITGEATVTITGGEARVVQNLTRVFGVRGDGCYSGYRDSSGSVFNLDVNNIEGSQSIEGTLKNEDDSYTWKLSGDEQSLSGLFVNDHHYCCTNGNHTGTAQGNVTLSRQNQGE